MRDQGIEECMSFNPKQDSRVESCCAAVLACSAYITLRKGAMMVRTKSLVSLLLFSTIILGWSSAHAQNVTITPLGSQQGEFCVGDRALLFVDPTGVRILSAPGRTVNGSGDPRLPKPSDPSGGGHVVLIDHPHVDHIGDVFHKNCAGTSTTRFMFPSAGNAPEIASVHNSAVLVGGEQSSFFAQKISDVPGTKIDPKNPSCPITPRGVDNMLSVPRTAPCVATIRGGTITVSFKGQQK